jgi:hypothetical protein
MARRLRATTIGLTEVFLPDRYGAAGWHEGALDPKVVTKREAMAVGGGRLLRRPRSENLGF